MFRQTFCSCICCHDGRDTIYGMITCFTKLSPFSEMRNKSNATRCVNFEPTYFGRLQSFFHPRHRYPHLIYLHSVQFNHLKLGPSPLTIPESPDINCLVLPQGNPKVCHDMAQCLPSRTRKYLLRDVQ